MSHTSPNAESQYSECCYAVCRGTLYYMEACIPEFTLVNYLKHFSGVNAIKTFIFVIHDRDK